MGFGGNPQKNLSRVITMPSEGAPVSDSDPLIVQCIKVPYESEAEAIVTHRGKRLRAYLCNLCRKWHNTHYIRLRR